MKAGDDLLVGFGNATVDGGNAGETLGRGDELGFGFALANFTQIDFGDVAGDEEVNFTLGSRTLFSNEFENFTFNFGQGRPAQTIAFADLASEAANAGVTVIGIV